MISIYDKQYLRAIDAKFIIKFLEGLTISRIGIMKAPMNKKEPKYLAFKKALEYKYCIRMPNIVGGQIEFNPHTTRVLLRVILPEIKDEELKKLAQSAIQRWKYATVSIYACGAIEKSPDGGVEYRQKLKELLAFTPAKIINPCDFTYNQNYKNMKEYRKVHNLKETYKFARQIVYGDINAVKSSDVLCVNIDKYLGFGSVSEVSIAFSCNIPIHGILSDDMSINNVHPWLLGCVDRFFDSMNAYRVFVGKSI